MQSTYTVNGKPFSSYMAAVRYADSIKADVIEVATGLRRWTPAVAKPARCIKHVLVNADGTEMEFFRVHR